MSNSLSEDTDLQAAVAGDRDALARLLMLHGDHLCRRISRRLELNPYADFSAEDVLQEAYVDAFLGIGSFDISRGSSFAAWIERVADNRMISMLRERRREKRGGNARRVVSDGWRSSAAELVAVLEDYRADSPSENVASDEIVTAIRTRTANLPEEQRHALQSHFLDQRSTESTAELLGKTDGAVRGLLHRAKQSIRVAMGNSSRWFLRK